MIHLDTHSPPYSAGKWVGVNSKVVHLFSGTVWRKWKTFTIIKPQDIFPFPHHPGFRSHTFILTSSVKPQTTHPIFFLSLGRLHYDITYGYSLLAVGKKKRKSLKGL